MADPLQTRNRKIIVHYRAGFTLRECAERFGITMQRVHQIIRILHPRLMRPPYVGMRRKVPARGE